MFVEAQVIITSLLNLVVVPLIVVLESPTHVLLGPDPDGEDKVVNGEGVALLQVPQKDTGSAPGLNNDVVAPLILLSLVMVLAGPTHVHLSPGLDGEDEEVDGKGVALLQVLQEETGKRH